MSKSHQDSMKCFDLFKPFIDQHHNATWTVQILSVEFDNPQKLIENQIECAAFTSLSQFFSWAGIPFTFELTSSCCVAYLPSTGGQLFTDINDLMRDYMGVEFRILEIALNDIRKMKSATDDYHFHVQLSKLKKLIVKVNTHLLDYECKKLSESELNYILDWISQSGIMNIPEGVLKKLHNHSNFLRRCG